MLDEMDAGQLAEWMAFDEIKRDAERKAELEAKAQQGVRNHRRGGR